MIVIQQRWSLKGESMDDKQKSKEYFNSYSSTVINKNGYWSYDYRITSEILKRRGVIKIFDVGCGNGAFLAFFKNKKQDAELYGLDLSHEMVMRSRERLPDAVIEEGDAEEIPFEDETFDGVSCHMSVHHHPHPKSSIAEMHRVLKNGGTVLINELTGPVWLKNFMNWCFTWMKTGDHAIYLEAEMTDMLKEAGFEHIKCRRITPFSYVCVGRKSFTPKKG